MLPREKAINYGISSLNNHELLALVIKSAYKEKNVLDLSKEIIEYASGFDNLLSLSYEELINIKGIKKAKALEILAILEIAKRLSKVEYIKEDSLNNPGKIVDWIRFNIGFKSNEEFYVIYLNAAGKVIKSEVLFVGCKNASVVGVDETMRRAILLKASAFVVCHNHPSGNVMPSFADKKITKELKGAGELLSIKLLDHIIVSKDNYFSFLKEGLL